jgi:hypothetical protein
MDAALDSVRQVMAPHIEFWFDLASPDWALGARLSA